MSADRPSPRERGFDVAAVVVLLIGSALVLWTWRDYGISWDEGVHKYYGEHIYQFFATRGEDQSALSYRIDYMYGGSYDLLGAVFGRLVVPPLDIWDALHLLGALVGPLGFWGCWRLARELGGARAGLLAALFILATSVYWGHAVNNPKDMPFAVGYVWAMVFLVQAIRALPRIPAGVAVKLAITMGLAMSVRIGGMLVVCYFAGALAVWVAYQAWQRRSPEAGYRYARRLAPRALAIVAGAWAVMLAAWPWAWFDPLRRPWIALTRMSKFLSHRRKMPFAGEEIYTYDVDWRYMPHYFGLKLPEFIVICALLAFVVAVGLLVVRARDHRRFADNLVLGTVLVSLAFPWVYAVAKHSVFYDGLRHFLFEVPVLVACVAWFVAASIEAAAARLARWRPWAGPASQLAAAGLVALLCVDQYVTMARLHPFELVYFNRFIGGVEGAVGNYDTDYYATTYNEAGAALVRHLWQTEPEAFLDTQYSVDGCAGRRVLLRETPANFRYDKGMSDFWLGYTREDCDQDHPESPIIVEVEREGARLNVVRDIRKWRDEELAAQARERAEKRAKTGKRKGAAPKRRAPWQGPKSKSEPAPAPEETP